MKLKLRRFKRKKVLARYKLVGLRHWLNFNRGIKFTLSYKHFDKFYKYSPLFYQTLKSFVKSAWHALIIPLQQDLNLSLNFLLSNLIEIFYMQLFFLIDKMICFFKELLNCLPLKQQSMSKICKKFIKIYKKSFFKSYKRPFKHVCQNNFFLIKI